MIDDTPVFTKLLFEDQELLIGSLKEAKFSDKKEIISQGKGNETFYVIKTGKASVNVSGKEVATLAPGQFFGERALLKDEPASATIVASGELTCYTCDRKTFTAVLGPLQAILDKEVARRDKMSKKSDKMAPKYARRHASPDPPLTPPSLQTPPRRPLTPQAPPPQTPPRSQALQMRRAQVGGPRGAPAARLRHLRPRAPRGTQADRADLRAQGDAQGADRRDEAAEEQCAHASRATRRAPRATRHAPRAKLRERRAPSAAAELVTAPCRLLSSCSPVAPLCPPPPPLRLRIWPQSSTRRRSLS